ncbi:hypothetical protein OMB55_00013470 [gamma proteobacterium HIMB55]|nr:hypothetical protein OMB55_00013470 [gamma proteobacterium HIMB55]
MSNGRLAKKALRVATLAICVSLLNACASGGNVSGSGFNPTTPKNAIDTDAIQAANIKRVVIADVNLGSPSRKYLQKREGDVDAIIAEAFERNGWEVVSPREFTQRWRNAVSMHGDPVDPTTGRVNSRTFSRIINTIKDQMMESSSIDALVFTDLLEKDVYFATGVNRVARWDGVTRKPPTQGGGQGVSVNFNWSVPVAATTVRISIFNSDLERMFVGEGGIALNEAVDTRSGTGFVRRREILGNETHIREGVALALHPLMPMKNWPGDPD